MAVVVFPAAVLCHSHSFVPTFAGGKCPSLQTGYYINTRQLVIFLPSPSYSGTATPPTGVKNAGDECLFPLVLFIAQEVSRFWFKHAILHSRVPLILANVFYCYPPAASSRAKHISQTS